MHKITVLLADDHAIVRKGIRAVLENEPDMDVVGEAETGRDAVQMAEELKPDVVIMDISMVDLNGIDATRQIIAAISGTKVIGLSMHSNKQFVQAMLRAGASGYLLKDCAFSEFATAVRQVMADKPYLSSSIASTVIQDYFHSVVESGPQPSSELTSREREVLQMIAEGNKTRQIASSLHVSVKTVETHRRNIINKLGLDSVAELTKFALKEGLTSLEF